MSPLPQSTVNQAFFEVSAIEAGLIIAPERIFVAPADGGKGITIPTLAFVLRHSKTNSRVIFDLGIRKKLHEYSPAIHELMKIVFNPSTLDKDVAEHLAEKNIGPADIDIVILSHVHWDHIGDHTAFTKAQFLLGGPGKSLVENGYPITPDASILQSTVPSDPSRTTWLSYDDWKPVGPFERGIDYFGDGSLYLIDAPGHLEGHINALVRTNADGGWVYLAGDSVHDGRILRGEKEIAQYIHPHTGDMICAHVDKAVAEDHIKRIRSLNENPRVEVILAHDYEWYNANKEVACWPHSLKPL